MVKEKAEIVLSKKNMYKIFKLMTNLNQINLKLKVIKICNKRITKISKIIILIKNSLIKTQIDH